MELLESHTTPPKVPVAGFWLPDFFSAGGNVVCCFMISVLREADSSRGVTDVCHFAFLDILQNNFDFMNCFASFFMVQDSQETQNP